MLIRNHLNFRITASKCIEKFRNLISSPDNLHDFVENWINQKPKEEVMSHE